jgi:flagellar hook-associated protein 3 FlgL
MVQMRVTDSSITTRVLANLQRNIARGGQIQEQLSSGKQISRPSDSPTGAISSMQLRGESRQNDQYTRNADDGLGWLGAIDDTLNDSMGRISKARELAIQGLNSGISTPASREALAVELENIKDGLIGLANVTYLNRPVFGGTTTGRTAYDASGAYQGNAGTVSRTVGSNAQVRVNANGPEVFGTGDTQLFAVLQGMADSLRANDPAALSAGLNKLVDAGDVVKSALADVGARYNRVSQMRDTAQDRLVTLTSQISDFEDIDLPKTIMEMQLQQTSYEAALAATAKVIQPSLIDYLR